MARVSLEAIVAQLHQLRPANQAEVLLLRVVRGPSVAEVAALRAKTPANVRVLQHRALQRLAARFPAREAA